MLKLSHSTLSFISGAIWAIVGISLLQLGLRLLLDAPNGNSSYPLLTLFDGFSSRQDAAIALVAIALYIGFLKGKYVLTKSAIRSVSHIQSLPNPAPLHKMYGRGYLILLAVMVGLGLSIKYLAVPNDIRGAIDVAIGGALIIGSVHFFRTGFQLRKEALHGS